MKPSGPDCLLASTSDYRQACLWGLVLSAMQIHHRLELQDGSWLLLVSMEDEPAARRELAAFEEENRHWPPAPPEAFAGGVSPHPPTVPLMGSLVAFHLVTGPWQEQNPWFVAGAVSRERIFLAGEWWRLVTGLTLHADPVHLLGNVLIGGVLVHFLCLRLGSGFGWMLLLLSGAVGNLINTWLRSEHLSVGFSTAVFGAVGLLSGLSLHRGAIRGRRLLLPLGAALSLLAFLGAEGPRTDLGAHLWGLAAGLVLGAGFPRFSIWQRLAAPQWQMSLLASSWLAVAFCWYFALE